MIWGFAFTIGWLGGVAYRSQLVILTELAIAQTRARPTRAAEEERHRLAREVHDLIAHSLAVTMLQMSGARLALAAGDTDEALAALADAETAGRSAMAEIHRTVGLLGRGDEGTQPTDTVCRRRARLVDGFRNAGLDVAFHLDGDLAAVPMGTGLAAYRVVQESLSNAVKHAPGAPVDLRSASARDRDRRPGGLNPIVPLRRQPRPRRRTGADRASGAWPSGPSSSAVRPGRATATARGRSRPASRGSEPSVIRVLLVDDQQLVRTGLRRILAPRTASRSWPSAATAPRSRRPSTPTDPTW